jgi:hypothetical protein
VAEYGVPSVPFGSDVVVTVRAVIGSTVIEIVCVTFCTGFDESLTVTGKE